MARNVTVTDLTPADLAKLKQLEKQSNPRQAAKKALQAGLDLLVPTESKTEAAPEPPLVFVESAPEAPEVPDAGEVDLTGEATPFSF